ncbi:DUF1440 domain-containing protein [Pontibacter harenae]|uniref:DUF1440 domain-containing protein n=1 Tax=Pontibacter harenae TaxID=2894083 RepID=UPI001E2D852C|nr:DUF1440 domain-containing protein [Pontibacter harenae]MCC9165392.1 DUF1440 domain-containing protein [Pontibacter harenae]
MKTESVKDMSKNQKSIAVGMLKGAIAGAVGMFAMYKASWYLYKNENPLAYKKEKEAQIEGNYVPHEMAKKASDAMGVELTDQQLDTAGKAVQVILGILPGIIYGTLYHKADKLGYWRGSAFGIIVFALVDELAAPLAGFSSGPTAYPWQAHARGFVDHLVYGVTTDNALRLIDRVTPA